MKRILFKDRYFVMLEVMGSHERMSFSEHEISRSARVLERRFVQRWDIHARQLGDGRYICLHKPLNFGHLVAHLRGDLTLGTYVLDQESRARFIVFDADDEPGFSELLRMAMDLSSESIPSYLELSRRGGHMWMFFGKATPSRKARAFGRGLLAAFDIKEIELFPKQDQLGEGPGSLIRLPFGVHRLSGQRYGFITPDGNHVAPTIREQIHALSTPQTVPEASIEIYISKAPSIPQSASYMRPEETAGTITNRIKTNVSVLEFVSQYVELTPTSNGGVGRCPFHDDHRPSFGVNDEGNYWHCFAGCGGGSVIDFWMKYRNCDFKTAVNELANVCSS